MTIPADSIHNPGPGESYNPAKDDAKLRELTTTGGGVPSRWVRCLAAEVLSLRSTLTAAEKRVQELERVHAAAALLATCDEYDLDRNYEALMQLVKP